MIKYPRPLRIRHNKITLNPKKRYLGDSDVKKLLSGKVFVEEKLDGSQCGIAFKGGKPIVYTKNSHLSEYDKRVAFKGLWDWVWSNLDKIESIPKGFRICGEWLRVQHYVKYDELPDFFIAFDVLDERTGQMLSHKAKIELFENLGYSYAPTILQGVVTKDDIYEITQGCSNFSTTDLMEGAVVKSDKQEFSGKLVTNEFLDGIEEVGHWTSIKTARFNKLKEGCE